MNDGGRQERLTLELLQTIEKENHVSQRRLAQQLGVALGLANSYLKRCVRKGYIKITEAPANRYFYYLTPQGFAEKSRLTARYLSYSFAFYKKAGDSCAKVFSECRKNGWRRVLLAGMSDLAEIASLRALEHGIEIIGVLDGTSEKERFVGLSVFEGLDQAPAYDACVVTDVAHASDVYERLIRAVEKERVLVPDILGITQ